MLRIYVYTVRLVSYELYLKRGFGGSAIIIQKVLGQDQRKFNLNKRMAVYFQNVNSFFPYNVPFSGFKSAINIRQMYFMNPLKPTSRCERIS